MRIDVESLQARLETFTVKIDNQQQKEDCLNAELKDLKKEHDDLYAVCALVKGFI